MLASGKTLLLQSARKKRQILKTAFDEKMNDSMFRALTHTADQIFKT